MTFGAYGFRETKPVQVSIPSGHAVERLAVGMAAANGVVWMQADEAAVGTYRRSAHAALILLADIGPTEGQSAGAAHWSATMLEATLCLRHACRMFEELPLTVEDDAWLKRLYRSATALDSGSQALSAVEPSPEEFV